MRNALFSAIAASTILASGLQAQVVTSYNITNVRLSGFGGWDHTYSGTITPAAGGLYNYTGGSGTLNDGLFASNNNNNMLFLASDNSVITLFLDGTYSLSALNLFGGNAPNNFIPGTLTGATIGFGAASAAITSAPFNVSGTCASGPCDDAFNFASTALAGETGSQITISNVQSGWGDYYSIAEVGAVGTAAVTTPEPASLMLVATGLVGLMGAKRRRTRTLSE